MIFKITRTSSSSKKPVDEAVEKMIDLWEFRSCSEEYYDAKYARRAGTWRSKGTDHYFDQKNNCICRKIGYEQIWVIEVQTLQDLQVLVKQHDSELIIDFTKIIANPGYEGMIEIYDGCRE